MIDDPQRQVIELPDRKEISLCEAVTAVIYGKAHDVNEERRRYQEYLSKIESKSLVEMFDRPTPADKPSVPDEQSPATAKLNELLKRLRDAAYAARIKFRAIKEGEDPANGYKDIDPLYFYVKPFFNWSQDVIFQDNQSATVWYFVHLDREQFASFLKDMDLEVKHEEGADERTGVPGRPSSIHLLLPEARRRLDAGQVPKSITVFSRELADWFKINYPRKMPLKPRSIENALRELWHAHKKAH